jgi:hypothetical protein
MPEKSAGFPVWLYRRRGSSRCKLNQRGRNVQHRRKEGPGSCFIRTPFRQKPSHGGQDTGLTKRLAGY